MSVAEDRLRWDAHYRPAGTLSSTEVTKEARITYRQLDSWARGGILRTVIPARGSGTQRRFDPEEARVAKAIGLLSRGLREMAGTQGRSGHAGLLRVIGVAVRESLATGKPAEVWPGVLVDARRLKL